MRPRNYLAMLTTALLTTGLLFSGCSDSDSTEDSATQAAAQLGLGGDSLSQPSLSLKVMSEGAQPGVWTSDFPAAQKLAAEKDLPMLLFFNGSDWSISSNALIQKLLDDQEWLEFLPNLVLVYLDRPRHNPNFPAELQEQNDALRMQFRVTDYPTMLLCTAEGQLAGNLHANSQSTAHDLVRDIKLFRRRIPSEIDKLVARINNPEISENYAAFKAASEAKQKLFAEFQAQVRELDKTMMRLGTKLEEDIAAWEVAQRSPEDQQAYHDASDALKPLRENAAQLLSLPRSAENQQKFQELQLQIQQQQRIIDEIIAK